MKLRLALVAVALSAFAAPAFAGFDGQPILGPLGPGSVVAGSTVGAADDNDGFTSGDHIFSIWNAGDDVYQLNWPGGPLTATLTYDNTSYDLDLFLYDPSSYNDSGNYSIINSGTEVIEVPDAVAGIYYLNIDGPEPTDVGAYTLSISAVPEPTSLLAFASAPLVLGRRRR